MNAQINNNQIGIKASYFNNSMNPIKIDNNGGTTGYINWTEAASLPWCTELNGTYYLENLTIETSGACIIIKDSSEKFKIRNCTLISSNSYDNGGALSLSNVNNGIITNNVIHSDYRGHGIYLSSSNDNIIANNDCSYNSASSYYHGSGIYLSNSVGNLIANNTCSHNSASYSGYEGNGIYLSNSDDNVIANNSCFNNHDYGISLSNCNDNVIVNNSCSNNEYSGISLNVCNLNTLANNTCFNNDDGISLSNSDNNDIIDDSCSDNDNHGISLSDSHYNTIVNSTYFNNREDGISLSNSDNNDIIDDSCSDNDNHGISLSVSHYNTIVNNTCSNNDNHGILLSNSDHNDIVNNTCSYNEQYNNKVYGLAVTGCLNTTILNNTCFNNANHGINIQDSNLTILENNTVSFNKQSGIYLSNVINFTLSHNDINNNSESGIFLNYCSNINPNYNNIVNNTIESNSIGIMLYHSEYIKIFLNNITNNVDYGIYLQKISNYNVIINNYLSNNGVYCICYEEDCINNVFNNPGCIPIQIQLPDDPSDDPNPYSRTPPILGYLYPTLFVLVFIGMISGLGYYSYSKRKKWRESGIEVDPYGTIIFREERNLYENYESEKPKIITPKEVKPYEFYCFSCQKKFIGHQVFCPECGERMKIFDPSITSSLPLKKERNNLNKCVLCHQSTCPTCTTDNSEGNACFEECPYCESIYHKHCWDIVIQKFGRCAFCLESPPQELINSDLNSSISNSQREADQNHK